MIQIGKKSLRLLVFAAFMGVCILAFSGCSTAKYEPVEPVAGTSELRNEGETMAFTIGALEEENTDRTLAETEAAVEESREAIVYQPVNDWVVVRADVLNVRAQDNMEARIYVQLKQGDVLERVGLHEEWSQVVYDGDVAYVATKMVEVTEAPEANAKASEGTSETLEEVSPESAGDDSKATVASETKSQESDVPVYEKTGTQQQEIVQKVLNGHVIAIDAGHQAKANAEKEPIGPDSATKKAKMPEGAVGTVTGTKEYELTLLVAKKLQSELEERGYQVVMIRNGHDVNLSNAERSIIANESGADIFIRLHANSMENSGIYGALAMCMTEQNPYNAELYTDSYNLSKKIINNICALTGTKNRGVQKVDNSSAINWCEIPVSVVEMGFLTNPDEDRWLSSEEYQGKIVEGIARAVDSYFTE